MRKIFGIFFVIVLSAVSEPEAGVFPETAHGNPVTGALRDIALPRGACAQCHVQSSKATKRASLWRENDNALCFTCHRDPGLSGFYPGQSIYESNNHNTNPRFIWPGPLPPPRREAGAQGKCLNCHTPHGAKDRSGPIPSLLIAREENLCLTCHDGSISSKNIAMDIRKPYSHRSRSVFGKRDDQRKSAFRYSDIRSTRSTECSDCHNAHAVLSDPTPPTAPLASSRNERVSRIRIVNRGAGVIPLYDFRQAGDTSAPVLEYEICFKCHSSWTRQIPGEQDMAMLFNTNNASFHPVEGKGKNPNINPNAFVGGMNPFSAVFCGDCHGSDDSALKGPHGSLFPHMLRKAYEANGFFRSTSRAELCFLCHSFNTYANSFSSVLEQQASRFNAPASPRGHTFHVVNKNVPCYSCHDSHGSPLFGALITLGKNPGLRSFSMNVNGGSCLSSCHGPKSYVNNYGR